MEPNKLILRPMSGKTSISGDLSSWFYHEISKLLPVMLMTLFCPALDFKTTFFMNAEIHDLG